MDSNTALTGEARSVTGSSTNQAAEEPDRARQSGPIDQLAVTDEVRLSGKEEHLVRCTYKVMGRKGLYNLSLQDIADEARMNKAMVKYYFGNKENLYLVTMRWVLGRVARRVRTAAFEVETPVKKLTQTIDSLFVSPKENYAFYLVFFDFVGYSARADLFSSVSNSYRDLCARSYRYIIEMGQKEGVFRVSDPQKAAYTVQAIIDGLFLQWLDTSNWKETHSELLDDCKASALAYLGYREEPINRAAAERVVSEDDSGGK
jgi:AcrR family transcriptional regulator